MVVNETAEATAPPPVEAKTSDADDHNNQRNDDGDGNGNVKVVGQEQDTILSDGAMTKDVTSSRSAVGDAELTTAITAAGLKKPSTSTKNEEKDSSKSASEDIKEEAKNAYEDKAPSDIFSRAMLPTSEHKSKPATKAAPTIIRRLRKSTRAIRFRTKMFTAAATNSSASVNGNVVGSTTQTQGNGAHSTTGNTGNGVSNSSAAITNTKTLNKGGRSRRAIFKRPAKKAPFVQATTRFVTSVFYKGSYMQIGDIVSLLDTGRNVYYAQIRGLLVDAYCEKSAFLTWLIPTQDSPDPKDGFDPATYLIGPDEEISRKLSYLEFVMHAPSNYYHDRTTPFPLPDSMNPDQQHGGYIWTHLPTYKREHNKAEQKSDGD